MFVFHRGLFSSRFHVCPLSRSLSAPSQFSPGVGRSPLPAAFGYQAKRLQGLPWAEHREGEVACLFKDEKGNCPLKNEIYKAIMGG